MSELQEAVIQGYLRNLKLPGIRTEYAQLARQAKAEDWPYEEYLRELLERELRSRQAKPGKGGRSIGNLSQWSCR